MHYERLNKDEAECRQLIDALKDEVDAIEMVLKLSGVSNPRDRIEVVFIPSPNLGVAFFPPISTM